MIRSLIALALSIMCMLPAQAAPLAGEPHLPLSSVLPGVGQNVGINLNLGSNGQSGAEVLNGSRLPGANLSTDLIQHAHVVLTNTQMKALHSTAVTVIPGVTGKTTVILGVMYTLTFGGSAFTSGGTVTLQYHTGTVAATTGIANTFFQGASTAWTTDSTIPALAVQGDNIEVVAASNNFATSTSGSAIVDVAYAQY